MQNTVFWGPFCPNLGKNEFSTKIELGHILTSISPNFKQKTRETDEPILRKNLN